MPFQRNGALMATHRLPQMLQSAWTTKSEGSPAFKKAVEKATQNGFFLGLDKSWLD
jgi:hypothetical protein